MDRNWAVALLAGASLAAVCGLSGEGFARGGGHFGGGREFRPEMREPHFGREIRRREEDRRPVEEQRDGDHTDAEDAAPRKDDADDRELDQAREQRDDATRDLDSRDLRHPVDRGHWNRNAFWNNRFGAHTFVCNNCRWGWAGGVFWPFALGDIFSYAWWPYAGPPAFWDYGLNVILTALFWPNGAYEWPDGYGAYARLDEGSSYQFAREAHQNVYSGAPANEAPPTASEDTTGLAQTCSGLAPGVAALPMDRVEQAVKPGKSQRAAFDRLKAVSAKAEAILKGACPSEPPLTLVGRLDALQQRLKAMVEAVDTLMAPLGDVSRSLNDEQRRALEALGGDQVRNADPLQMSDIGGCVDEGQQFTDVPLQQIEQSVRPDARQKTALDQLKSVSTEAAQKLRLSCPTSVAATPEARLEAMDKRLRDTIVAMNEVRPALLGFYDSLSDEQKARFDTLPPEQATK